MRRDRAEIIIRTGLCTRCVGPVHEGLSRCAPCASPKAAGRPRRPGGGRRLTPLQEARKGPDGDRLRRARDRGAGRLGIAPPRRAEPSEAERSQRRASDRRAEGEELPRTGRRTGGRPCSTCNPMTVRSPWRATLCWLSWAGCRRREGRAGPRPHPAPPGPRGPTDRAAGKRDWHALWRTGLTPCALVISAVPWPGALTGRSVRVDHQARAAWCSHARKVGEMHSTCRNCCPCRRCPC